MTGLPTLPPLKPCPFCGSTLKPDLNRNTGAAHPTNTDCILSGWFIGAANLKLFNKRRSILRYNLVENKPVFNNEARGEKVTADFLNQVVSYYEKLAKSCTD